MLPYPTPPSGGGLYIIRLSDTHYYGGRTANFRVRWCDHYRLLRSGRHKNRHMQVVFNKYGVFVPEVLCVLTGDVAQVEAEQAWLDEHHGKPGCVNLSRAATTGANPHSLEGRFRISRSLQGRTLTLAHRQAISRGNKGRKLTPEHIAILRECNTGREWTPEMRQRNSEAHKGLRRSEASVEKQRETWKSRPDLVEKARESLNRNRVHVDATERNRKTGEKLRGRKQDPEAVEKRAASNRGRKNTPETLARMSESAKRRAQAQPTSHGSATRSLISAQQRGRVWVNDGQVNQRLFPEEADRLLACGWRKGRVAHR